MNRFQQSLVIGCSALALASCGPDDIASPGSGGVVINNPAPVPPPPPPPVVPTTSVAAAAGSCPAGTLEQPTVASGPQGTWRVCRLPNLIRTSMTLPKIPGLIYELNGRVNVGCDGGFRAPTAAYTSGTPGCTTPLTADDNVTLNIAPGVILYGNTGQSWLSVNRGNKINAVGTETQPIIFTAKANVTGFDLTNNALTDATQGQWGGIVLFGRGLTTDGISCSATGNPSTHDCERETEGDVDRTRYGGNDNAYNAGRMSYVQIRYSGFVLGSNSELQSLTAQAIGTGTVLDHIQSHNSSDDGFEFFGGAPRIKYFVATGADDDSMDIDTGAQADIQYALLLQRPGDGDTMMEFDSAGAGLSDLPRTRIRVSNFVGIQPQSSPDNEGSGGRGAAIFLTGIADTKLYNGIVVSPNNECIRMSGSPNSATLEAQSLRLQCGATKYRGDAAITPAQIAGFVNASGNNSSDDYIPTLTNLFVNGATENGVVAFNANAVSSFFDLPSPNRIGVAWDGNTSWYTRWTCNSSIVNFGTANSGACTSLPVT